MDVKKIATDGLALCVLPRCRSVFSRVVMSAGLSVEDKDHLHQLHQRKFRAMKAPFQNVTDRRTRGAIAAGCLSLFFIIASAFR